MAPDLLYGVSDETIARVQEILGARSERSDWIAALRAEVDPLHAHDCANLIEQLSRDDRQAFMEGLGSTLSPEILSYLDESVRLEVVEGLEPQVLADAMGELESDDAVDILEDLSEVQRDAVLGWMPHLERSLAEESLNFPEGSAGRIMRREIVGVPVDWSVGQTIDFLRNPLNELPDSFHIILVLEENRTLLGWVELSRLLRTRRGMALASIMSAPKVVPADMDEEDVVHLFRQYGLTEAPVVESRVEAEGSAETLGRVLGVVTIDDIMEVMDEKHEGDLLRLGGVVIDDLYAATTRTALSRLPWLGVNLLTALLASFVIQRFEAEIAMVVALAVLMPIVASMGGNAGTQTMTVAVRALAVNELTAANGLRILLKETLVGGLNGFVFALASGAVAWAWFGDGRVALVIGMAMVINLFTAGMVGVAIPWSLDRMGHDPALASGVILTTITDVVGFMGFLGLASWIVF